MVVRVGMSEAERKSGQRAGEQGTDSDKESFGEGQFPAQTENLLHTSPWDGTILWVEGAQSLQEAGTGRKSPPFLTGRTGPEIAKDSDFTD